MSANLGGVHPSLIAAVTKIINAMQVIGYPMMVTDALRTTAQQQTLWQQGRLTPGHIVTQCDGVTKRSNHQTHEDGFGHACDLTFVVNGVPSWDDALPWSLYGAMAKTLGCRWGGDFTTMVDKPHIEWP